MEFIFLRFVPKSPLDVSHTPSGDFRTIQEIFPIFMFHKGGIKPPLVKKGTNVFYIRPFHYSSLNLIISLTIYLPVACAKLSPAATSSSGSFLNSPGISREIFPS